MFPLAMQRRNYTSVSHRKPQKLWFKTQESTKAYHDNGLCLAASGLNANLVNSNFGLENIKKTYDTLLPCLIFLLSTLLTAQNDYERKKGAEKIGKHDMAVKVHSLAFPLI